MSGYGRIVSAPMIERGVEVCLRYWLPGYLGETLAQAGHPRDALPDPSDLTRMSEFAWPVETAVAVVVVATPGTSGDAEIDGEQPDGPAYTLTWDVRAAVLADVGDALHSREASQFYAAAAGTALAHHGVAVVAGDLRTWVRDVDGELVTLEGASVRLVGERYRQRAAREGRALIAGEVLLTVSVENARALYAGGDLPIPDDPIPGEEGPRDPIPDVEPASVTPSLTINRIPVEEA